MGTNLHKSKRTSRKGILSETERAAIKKGSLLRQQKWELTNTKKGTLLERLRAFREDLELIFQNKDFDQWASHYKVREELQRISALTEDNTQFTIRPIFRLAAIKKGGKNLYCLKRIEYDKPRLPSTDNERIELMTKGLKANQKLLVIHYVKVVGYNFPLKEGNEYTWKQVKDLLSKKILEFGSKL